MLEATCQIYYSGVWPSLETRPVGYLYTSVVNMCASGVGKKLKATRNRSLAVKITSSYFARITSLSSRSRQNECTLPCPTLDPNFVARGWARQHGSVRRNPAAAPGTAERQVPTVSQRIPRPVRRNRRHSVRIFLPVGDAFCCIRVLLYT